MCCRRHLTWIGVSLALSLLTASTIHAKDLDFSGQLKLDKRFLSEQKDLPQLPMYHQAWLTLQAYPNDQLELNVSTKLRLYDVAMSAVLADLSDVQQAMPMDILLWESYVQIYDLIPDLLDVRVGKQRIAWGTADRFNPTDNLNPDDLSDFLDFGAKLPSWSVLVEINTGSDALRKLSAIWLPGPVPALLPRYGGFSLSSSLGDSLSTSTPPGISTRMGTIDVALPSANLAHSMQALKVNGGLFGIDWSASYFHGYDDIPLEHSFVVNMQSPQQIRIDGSVILPEMHVAGFDFAGELFSVGWWLEGAVFFPLEQALSLTAPTLQGVQTQSTTILHSDPYTKLTAGIDYTFFWGTYVNLQYVHGLFSERGSALHDYFVIALQHGFFDGSVKLTSGFVFETDAFVDVEDNFGVSISSDIAFKPLDNVDLSIGHVLIGGQGKALFASMNHGDQSYIKLKVSF